MEIMKKNKIGEEELDVGYVLEVSCQKKEMNEFPVTSAEDDVQIVDRNSSAKPLPTVENKFNLIVFVGNLNEEVTAASVRELFMKETGILENELVNASMLWKVKEDVKVLTFTFIEFTSEQAFLAALKLNNSLHNGRKLLVLPSAQTHCGLFQMEKEVDCKKEDKEAEKLQEIEKLHEINKIQETEKLQEAGKLQETGNAQAAGKAVETAPETEKTQEVGKEKDAEKTQETEKTQEAGKEQETEKRQEAGKEQDIRKKVEVGKVQEAGKLELTEEFRSTEKVKETKTKSTSNDDYIPVYKKSGYVAYLKHLPPDVTDEDVLQLFNFTRNDVVDIFILKNTRGRKSNSKRSEVRAVIAFPSEENLEKCLAQSCKSFRNLCVVVERHGMSRNTSGGEKRSFSLSALNDCNEITSSPKRQILSDATERKVDSIDKIELDLFVKHINWNASDRVIRDFFASVGARIQGMKQFGEPGTKVRGMGFVTMADKESLLRGLALDGAVLLGNKIKVSIRNDRKFLLRPIEDEIPPNYSTFVAKLPIKKSVETLKSALTKFLKEADCSVKSMFVPLADNHSGNRGYAFVTFEDEKSLTKAVEFNGSEVQICDSKVKITVSNHWPENLKETMDTVLKNKDSEYKHGNVNVEQEASKSGKQHRRKRKGPSSPHRGTIYKNQREVSKKFALQESSALDYPLNQQQRVSNYNLYDSDYIAYLDYLEFRDYVAMRKAYDERQVLAEHQTHQEPENRDEFCQKQKDGQSYILPGSQSSFGTNVTRTYQEPISEPKECTRESRWRNYSSFTSSGCGSCVGYNHLQQSSVTSTNSYDKIVQNPIPVSSHRYEKLSQAPLTATSSGYAKIRQGSASSTSISRDKPAPRPSNVDSKGSFNPVWAPSSDRYNTNKISLPASDWYGSNSQSCWERRESEVLPQRTLSSNDSGSRGIKLSSCSQIYATERGNNIYTSQHSSPTPALGSTHSPSVRTSKSDHDVAGLYSRMDRKSSSYGLGSGQNSLMSYPVSSEGTNWTSYSAGSSTNSQTNEAYSYVEYPNSVAKRGDEQRSNAVNEKSGSFVNKLLTSGILSNAGYNVTVGGYHAN